MLEVIHLTKKYGKTLAVDDVGFAVPDGQTGILLGPNGAGKSTVMGIISRLIARDRIPAAWKRRNSLPMCRNSPICTTLSRYGNTWNSSAGPMA